MKLQTVQAIDLTVSQTTIDEGTRRLLQLRNVNDVLHREVNIFYDLLGQRPSCPPVVLDGFVFAVLLYAMKSGQNIRVHGRLSRQACFNIAELQEAWASWCPDLYNKIQILPDDIVDLSRAEGPPSAIAAFSGGVDSMFTALRHRLKWAGNGSYPLNALMMVHGFDVRLNTPSGFRLLVERFTPILNELDLPLHIVRTNSRETRIQSWAHSHMAELACCLHNFSDRFQYGLVAAGLPYTHPITAWGSTAATDHLLSGDLMRLVDDGGGYSRTDKTGALAGVPTACRALKVCHEGLEAHLNCGKCEKCVRTQLNFLASGVRNPPCFEEPLDDRRIATIRLQNEAQWEELRTIYDDALRGGMDEPWMKILEERLDRYKPPGFTGRIASLARRTARFLYRRVRVKLARNP